MTKPIIQTTRDGQKVTVHSSKGGVQVIIEPKADKYKKRD
jgi:hypothetical protein|tara:strand:- start:459 stop:578 length:120 start_codon:yes stop_codon:yes gene_type:complete